MDIILALSLLELWRGRNEMTSVKLSAQSLAQSECSVFSVIIVNFEQHLQGSEAGTSSSGCGYGARKVRPDSPFRGSFHFVLSSSVCPDPRRVSEVVLLNPPSQAQLCLPVGCSPFTPAPSPWASPRGLRRAPHPALEALQQLLVVLRT